MATSSHTSGGTWDWAYLSYTLLGVGLLMPWNGFLTAVDYYAVRYKGVHVDRLITVCYLPVNLLFIASFIHFHEVVRSRPRILGGFGAFTLAVTAMPLLDMFIPAGNGSLAVMLLLVAVCGMADGACQGALFGEAATLDPRYTQALITGTAISGVVMSLLRILTKGLLPATPEGLRASASLYFLAAALLCISCIIVYTAVLPRLLRTKHQPRGVVYSATAFDSSNASEEGGQELQHSRPAALEPQQGGRQADDELAGLVAPGALLSSAGAGQSLTSGAPVSYLDVAWQVRGYAGSLVLVYVVTLSIFPGVLAEDVASEKLSSWYPVLLIAAFNVADAVGKWLPALPACRIRDARKIAVAAAARVVFIPAFYFAAINGAGAVVIGLLALLLGLSNGLLTTAAMVAAPDSVEPRAAALCGNIMVLSLILGLCIGAASGFIWLL